MHIKSLLNSLAVAVVCGAFSARAASSILATEQYVDNKVSDGVASANQYTDNAATSMVRFLTRDTWNAPLQEEVDPIFGEWAQTNRLSEKRSVLDMAVYEDVYAPWTLVTSAGFQYQLDYVREEEVWRGDGFEMAYLDGWRLGVNGHPIGIVSGSETNLFVRFADQGGQTIYDATRPYVRAIIPIDDRLATANDLTNVVDTTSITNVVASGDSVTVEVVDRTATITVDVPDPDFTQSNQTLVDTIRAEVPEAVDFSANNSNLVATIEATAPEAVDFTQSNDTLVGTIGSVVEEALSGYATSEEVNTKRGRLDRVVYEDVGGEVLPTEDRLATTTDVQIAISGIDTSNLVTTNELDGAINAAVYDRRMLGDLGVYTQVVTTVVKSFDGSGAAWGFSEEGDFPMTWNEDGWYDYNGLQTLQWSLMYNPTGSVWTLWSNAAGFSKSIVAPYDASTLTFTEIPYGPSVTTIYRDGDIVADVESNTEYFSTGNVLATTNDVARSIAGNAVMKDVPVPYSNGSVCIGSNGVVIAGMTSGYQIRLWNGGIWDFSNPETPYSSVGRMELLPEGGIAIGAASNNLGKYYPWGVQPNGQQYVWVWSDFVRGTNLVDDISSEHAWDRHVPTAYATKMYADSVALGVATDGTNYAEKVASDVAQMATNLFGSVDHTKLTSEDGLIYQMVDGGVYLAPSYFVQSIATTNETFRYDFVSNFVWSCASGRFGSEALLWFDEAQFRWIYKDGVISRSTAGNLLDETVIFGTSFGTFARYLSATGTPSKLRQVVYEDDLAGYATTGDVATAVSASSASLEQDIGLTGEYGEWIVSPANGVFGSVRWIDGEWCFCERNDEFFQGTGVTDPQATELATEFEGVNYTATRPRLGWQPKRDKMDLDIYQKGYASWLVHTEVEFSPDALDYNIESGKWTGLWNSQEYFLWQLWFEGGVWNYSFQLNPDDTPSTGTISVSQSALTITTPYATLTRDSYAPEYTATGDRLATTNDLSNVVVDTSGLATTNDVSVKRDKMDMVVYGKDYAAWSGDVYGRAMSYGYAGNNHWTATNPDDEGLSAWEIWFYDAGSTSPVGTSGPIWYFDCYDSTFELSAEKETLSLTSSERATSLTRPYVYAVLETEDRLATTNDVARMATRCVVTNVVTTTNASVQTIAGALNIGSENDSGAPGGNLTVAKWEDGGGDLGIITIAPQYMGGEIEIDGVSEGETPISRTVYKNGQIVSYHSGDNNGNSFWLYEELDGTKSNMIARIKDIDAAVEAIALGSGSNSVLAINGYATNLTVRGTFETDNLSVSAGGTVSFGTSSLAPDGSPVATSNMVENIIGGSVRSAAAAMSMVSLVPLDGTNILQNAAYNYLSQTAVNSPYPIRFPESMSGISRQMYLVFDCTDTATAQLTFPSDSTILVPGGNATGFEPEVGLNIYKFEEVRNNTFLVTRTLGTPLASAE